MSFKAPGRSGIVILDTETTGLENDDEIVELSIVASTGEVLYSSLFEPQKQVHPGAGKKTGLWNNILIGQPKFIDEWPKIRKAIGKATVVCHNVEFDSRMVRQTLERYGLDGAEADNVFRKSFCTLLMSKFLFPESGHSLEKMCNMLQVPRATAHRATGDCLMTLNLLVALQAYMNRQSPVFFEACDKKPSKVELRTERICAFILEGRKLPEIQTELGISSSILENTVMELFGKGKIKAELLLSPEKEHMILDGLSSCKDWAESRRLKPIKELLGESISYLEIRLALARHWLSHTQINKSTPAAFLDACRNAKAVGISHPNSPLDCLRRVMKDGTVLKDIDSPLVIDSWQYQVICDVAVENDPDAAQYVLEDKVSKEFLDALPETSNSPSL